MISGDYLTYNYTTPVTAPYGELWRILRRLTALDVSSPGRVAAFSDIRRNEIRLLMNRIMKRCDGEGGTATLDMKEMFIELCFNTLSMTIAGKRYYGDDVADIEEARMAQFIMKEMLRLSGNTNMADFLPFLRWADFQGLEKKFSKFKDQMDNFLQGLVDYCRQNMRSGLDNARTNPTLIEHMLTLQKEEPKLYSDQQIKAVSLVLLVAVTDTLSITLEWALSLLLNHPIIMKKVESEINANIPPNRLLTEEDLPNLPYLNNVVIETLRLYPPLPFLLPHAADVDCTVAGFDVPRGTMLLVNLWGLHRDPKLWDGPDNFVPERHEIKNKIGEKKSSCNNMIPFGVGRRGCPGIGMAHRVIGLGLGSLIQVFQWKRVDEEKIDMSELSGMNLPKAQPLLAICKPRPMIIGFSMVPS
ncbi:cytochrome P450 81Q32-like [Impatiens glandulifera]|uniref:cytochrome P450 81Q32-like n=1 Tax=Impatiens glandulifera TaxID=253017 RepID=UPI001FB09270|nr:cytochrome P450 81Q32-like [Impatiens glandulifera]